MKEPCDLANVQGAVLCLLELGPASTNKNEAPLAPSHSVLMGPSEIRAGAVGNCKIIIC